MKMHKSVLLHETIDLLKPRKGDLVIDATAGAGGHTLALAQAVGRSGAVLALDQDDEAIKIARNVTRGENVTFVRSNFIDIADVAHQNGFDRVDVILADIGVSSMQLDEAARGFSLKSRGVLDMRMDKRQEFSALEVVNNYDENELADIFFRYGEESRARAVARAIVEARKVKAIRETDQLAEVVRGVARVRKGPGGKKIDPATKVFQAIRIEVNQELKNLESALPQMVRILKPGGRLGIISFHSLEDRIVKDFFRRSAQSCICPPELLKCACDHKQTLKLITRKPVMASEGEIRENPRSRSAKLRVAEKI
jgi:16S rRNA (cytosine1402-N4)-methyltransferase